MLHLPLEDEGFDFSVLSEFRDRLIEGKAEKRVFEKLVEQIRAMGLIKERGKQRSDSIAMLVDVRGEARAQKLWALSDMIRDKLKELGVTIEDSKDGTSWRWS